MANENQEKIYEKELWLYAGRTRSTVKGKLWKKFIPLDAKNQMTSQAHCYEMKKASCVIGGVYSVDVWRGAETSDVSILPSSVKFERNFDDQEVINSFALTDKLLGEELEEYRLEKKYAKRNGFQMPEDLSEVADLYNKLPWSQKKYFMLLLEKEFQSRAK